MSYQRKSAWRPREDYQSGKTKVLVHWSNKSSAYSINFSNTNHWTEMQILIGYIKNIPYGERDTQCDDSSGKKIWTWYLIEKHILSFNEMVKALDMYFDLDFIEKPIGQTAQAVFIPVDVYLDKFKNLVGESIKDLEYDKAKKIYRKWIMKNHPDVGGDPAIASEVNTCWTELERVYFKTRKEVEYANT